MENFEFTSSKNESFYYNTKCHSIINQAFNEKLIALTSLQMLTFRKKINSALKYEIL